MRKNGVTLLELLIYVAILSIGIMAALNLFFIVTRIRAQSGAELIVNENGRVALAKVKNAILDASLAATPGTCPLNRLDLDIGGSTTTFRVTSGILEIVEGASPAAAITADSVIATTSADCLFTLINNPAPAKATIQVKLRVKYDAPGSYFREVSKDYQTTVSLR